MTIRQAVSAEAEQIARVINAAFKPAESFFVDGDRTDLAHVLEYFRKGVFLVPDHLGGCVYVELRGDRAYFGLLSVDPSRQKSGTGKRLIAAAEDYARNHGCRFLDITVVNLRAELPPFYRSLGYVESGTRQFDGEDAPTKLPCHFICMTKPLTSPSDT